MITCDEAFETAKQEHSNINRCSEYENGYIFTFPECEMSIGGYDTSPVVVLKENGKVVPMIEFIDIIGPGEFVEEWMIDCGGIQPYNSIVQLQLTISGFFYGMETSTCVASGGQVEIATEQMLHHEEGCSSRMYTVFKNEFLDKLSKIHIEEWEKEYYAPVLDGMQWELEICYEGGNEPIHIEGSNAYPDNFQELVELTKIEEESD